jgi:hypothetical protein
LLIVGAMACERAACWRCSGSAGSHTLDGACRLKASVWRLVHFEFGQRLGKRIWERKF